MVALSAFLLVGFLTGFFFLDQFTQTLGALGLASVAGDDLVLASIAGFQLSVSLSALRVFLAGGSVFFEFVIIILSMFDRVVDTLKAILRPLLMIIPIVLFIYYSYTTFEPVIRSLLPEELGGANPNYIAASASSGTLPNNLLITFGAMIFFLLMSSILGDNPAAEIESLRSELRKCQAKQRSKS